jgi:hypothetical protein
MKLKNQAPPPSTKGKSKPKVTGTNRRKSTRKNEAGSGSKLKAPPKLTRTSETNAFATSTTKKQKCTCSPTKSPMKKTKQKYYNVTPMEEDETWKTVLGKAYCKTKKVLNGNDSDDEWPTDANFFPSDDELDNSDNEVKFTKKMKVQPKTVLSSSDEEDDAEVKIVGVKKAKENYYKNLAPTTNEEDESEDDEEDEDDDREEEAGDVPPTFDTHTATKFGYKDSSVDLSSDEKESKDEDPSSKESPSEEESSASDNKSTSNTSAHSMTKQPKSQTNQQWNNVSWKTTADGSVLRNPQLQMQEPLVSQQGYLGNMEATSQILNGTYVCPPELETETQLFISALRVTSPTMMASKVSTSVTKEASNHTGSRQENVRHHRYQTSILDTTRHQLNLTMYQRSMPYSQKLLSRLATPRPDGKTVCR